ncbi:hypothetical protein M2140_000074 [Clostridiales Family XIII bacterium PM5-7]
MDVEKFLKTWKRMCIYNEHNCEECLAEGYCIVNPQKRNDIALSTAVENWLKDHPSKTRQDVFLEQFPNSKLDNGTLFLAPCYLDDTLLGLDCNSFCDRVKKYGSCFNCKVEYWNEEVK